MTREIRRPKSDMNSWPTWLIGPKVSNATGKNKCVREMSTYLVSLRDAAASAAAAAAHLDVLVTYEAAKVFYFLFF